MTKLLDHAIARIRQLPSEQQDEAAELLLSLADQDPDTIQLSAEQVAEVVRRLGQPAEYVDHAEVCAYFQKRGG